VCRKRFKKATRERRKSAKHETRNWHTPATEPVIILVSRRYFVNLYKYWFSTLAQHFFGVYGLSIELGTDLFQLKL